MTRTAGHAAYAKSTAATASPAKIVLMCYQRILTACDRMEEAATHRPSGWIQVFHDECIRAEQIITELAGMTDRESSDRAVAEMSKNLVDLYVFCLRELAEANASKDPAKLATVRDTIGDLADGWAAANVGEQS